MCRGCWLFISMSGKHESKLKSSRFRTTSASHCMQFQQTALRLMVEPSGAGISGLRSGLMMLCTELGS